MRPVLGLNARNLTEPSHFKEAPLAAIILDFLEVSILKPHFTTSSSEIRDLEAPVSGKTLISKLFLVSVRAPPNPRSAKRMLRRGVLSPG